MMSNLEKMFYEREDKYYLLFTSGKYEEAWNLWFKTAEIFKPSDLETQEYYFYLEDAFTYGIMSKRFDVGNEHLEEFMNCCLYRADKGARELTVGKFLYEQGKYDLAAEYLKITYNNKFSKVLFTKKENRKYLEFIESFLKNKEIVNSSTNANNAVSNQELMEHYDENFEILQDLCNKGNEAFDDEKYDEALDYFQKAWDMIPLPKGLYDATIWVASALGDTLFELEQYEKSKAYFEEAYYAPEGKLNPFVNLMLGKCYYVLDKKEEAVPYLKMAYELEGEEIFEDEETELIELAK